MKCEIKRDQIAHICRGVGKSCNQIISISPLFKARVNDKVNISLIDFVNSSMIIYVFTISETNCISFSICRITNNIHFLQYLIEYGL